MTFQCSQHDQQCCFLITRDQNNAENKVELQKYNIIKPYKMVNGFSAKYAIHLVSIHFIFSSGHAAPVAQWTSALDF